ncbi:hypothetical protein V2W45_1331835 [Cenococcum geophilum]
MAAYNKREHPIIFKVILALYLTQEKRLAVLKPLANSTNYFTSDNDDASDTVRHSRAGKLSAKLFINEETAAIRLNRNTTLLKAFAERLVRKGTTIPLPRDRARDIKLDTIPEKDNKKEKDNNAAKLKDNTFNIPTALEEYINLTAI